MRRWDIIGSALGFGIAVFDLGMFAWSGLDVPGLTQSFVGLSVLAGFTTGYGAFGFASGRLYMARLRSQADAAHIAAQLVEIEESRFKLAQSEKLAALGRLAAGIAHEVRNPLGVIRASASMVQEELEVGTDDHRACELITNEIDRLDGLIGGLLAFAKPARMALTTTPLAPVLEHAAKLATEANGIEVSADDNDLAVRADRDLLTQLLLGFFLNASQAGAAHVRVRATQTQTRVRVEIADDGSGIDEADVARVFEPFFTTKDTGTGLGLSMAARIVEAHGGTIEVVQDAGLGEDGRGACFTVQLPVEGPSVVTEAA